MVRYFLIKGMILGAITGLLSTFFESLFMSPLSIYIPPFYPFTLIIFNTLLWMNIGCFSGFCMWVYYRKGMSKEKEALSWIFFYCFPFAILYGFFGYLNIEKLSFEHGGKFEQGKNFPFLVVILFFLFLIIFRQQVIEKRKLAVSLLPEIFFIISIYWVSSNFTVFLLGLRLNIFESLQPANAVFVNRIGVAVLAGLYLIMFFRLKIVLKKQWKALVILSLITACFSLSNMFINHLLNKTATGNLPGAVLPRNGINKLNNDMAIPHVILIVLDTVRANRLPIYNAGITLKNFTAFANDSLLFENCIAPAPWTAPSHASLFTGLYPAEHEVHEISGNILFSKLDDNFVTLAEIFEKAGYATAGIVSNRGVLAPWTNMNQGFQIYSYDAGIGQICKTYPFKPLMPLLSYVFNVAPKNYSHYKTAEDINSTVLYWIDKLAPSPFFLFVNYMDAHHPYRPPQPSARCFFPEFYRIKQALLRRLKIGNQSDWRAAVYLSRYDGAIAYLDAKLGELFQELKRRGIYDSALIIVTSDHGEMLGEHNLFGHGAEQGIPLYEGVLKIPLLIKFPYSKTTGREKRMISLTDLYPTIVSFCGLPMPDNVKRQPFGMDPLPFVSEVYHTKYGANRILYDGIYKYFKYQKKEAELYNLENDPAELDNLIAERFAVTARMGKKLEDWEKHYVRAEQKKTVPSPG